jgi:hypothetical protein
MTIFNGGREIRTGTDTFLQLQSTMLQFKHPASFERMFSEVNRLVMESTIFSKQGHKSSVFDG